MADLQAALNCIKVDATVKWVDPVRLKCAVQGCQNPGETCNYVICSTDLYGEIIPGLPQYVKLYLCDSCYAVLKDGPNLHSVSCPEPKILDPFDFTECSANTYPYPTQNGIQYGTKPHAVEYCRCMECAKARTDMHAWIDEELHKTIKGE